MKYFILLTLNTLWFGFFCYCILFRDWSPWSLAVPILFHFSSGNDDECEDE